MAVHVDHQAHNPLECHGCAVITLMDVRRRLLALQRRLPTMDGPGDAHEAVTGILEHVPAYERSVE